ncbi:efflux RND transporter periplasmic adaptor subunit [Psychrosphaera sp. 1_MG-2023]|uniref:efflux RND transporter periplasmic adaptor subunit n=1 Tax=Psychrosphaera sp. 1_MG-2023 TaxID=3062643 RepID=UPI0026E3CBB9|nr:efflux RND transporter periplasmic adaptor subunit [Psychrosphaera sp. 1_MG-2023]MDO6717825.1 efflux RND transporter periplasmic adaptor subunit [Psychrosphaera sp. 1_MG-2023]
MSNINSLNSTSKLKKKLTAIVIMLAAIALAFFIFSNPPVAKREFKAPKAQMTVDVKNIKPELYQVYLDSFGTVKPRTQSKLVAQVSGQIDAISPKFREGGFFKKGDWLVTIDDRDYKVDVKVAEASLLDAQQQLAEEQARSDQARADWKRIGKGGEPNDLVLRLPQLKAAEANVLSAEARLEKAQLALERTKVHAPYDGRILTKQVDVGQVVSNNAYLADIFASDYVEVRLPINNNDIPLINLPEQQQETDIMAPGQVHFSSRFDNQDWAGKLVRTESSIDSNSQQLYVVAQIDDPYVVKANGMTSLKIGQYLTARLAGKILSDVIVIPNKAIYQGSYVYVVEEGVLKRREIQILWKNSSDAIINSGLEEGDRLVLTSLGQVSSGTPVTINGEAKVTKIKPGKNNFERKFDQLPAKAQERIKQLAAEKGVSVDEAMKMHRPRKDKQATSGQGDK